MLDYIQTTIIQYSYCCG